MTKCYIPQRWERLLLYWWRRVKAPENMARMFIHTAGNFTTNFTTVELSFWFACAEAQGIKFSLSEFASDFLLTPKSVLSPLMTPVPAFKMAVVGIRKTRAAHLCPGENQQQKVYKWWCNHHKKNKDKDDKYKLSKIRSCYHRHDLKYFN